MEHYKNTSLNSIPNEDWREIPETNGCYMASNMGRIKSCYRKVNHPFGGLKTIPEKILKQRIDVGGYLITRLSVDGRKITSMVHVLVARAFISNPNKKPFINHIKGIKTDNRPGELEWCTQSENTIHAFALGLMKPKIGEENKSSKLTAAQVCQIKFLLNEGLTQYKIAKMFGVNKVTIFDIKHGKTWNHITI